MNEQGSRLPPPLQPGDLLRVIAPSGALRNVTALHQGLTIWRDRGYQVELPEDIDRRSGYLAGTDSDRVHQFLEAILDPHCRGIICARGGYGGARLLETLPKDALVPLSQHLGHQWLIGFSDITALLWGLYCHGFMGGVHGPLLTTLATEPPWTVDRLFQCLTGSQPLAALAGTGWGGGKVSGPLLPANLTVATHVLNTVWQPNLNGVILAFEDVSEAPYRIDRMLTQWRMTHSFRGVVGIALGRFSQCHAPENIPSFTLDQVLRDRLGDLGIPIVSGLAFGHDGENAALPVGVSACLDGDAGLLSFSEAVS